MTTQERLAAIKGRIDITVSRCREKDVPEGQLEKDVRAMLEIAQYFQDTHNAALALLDYDPSETDLVANITRLKAYYEQELATVRQGCQNLQNYCDRLIAASDPVVAVSTAVKTLSHPHRTPATETHETKNHD